MSTTEDWKRGRRLKVSLSVVLANGEGKYVIETKNVSDMGLCLHLKEALPVGSQLHLVFGRPPELPRLRAQGIVRWCEGGNGVGVEFISISPDDQQTILRFMHSKFRRAQSSAVATAQT